MDMLIDLAGSEKWEPKSAMEKAKGKPVLWKSQRHRNWLAQVQRQKRANVRLMTKGLVECLFKKQLKPQILWESTDLMFIH